MKLDGLIDLYENLSPERIGDLAEFYAADAWFKDPFNEVRGVPAIERIFRHMYEQVAEPRFFIREKIADDQSAMLVWEFRFRTKGCGQGEMQVMRGASHLKFDAEGKVRYHRDYWDTGEELYLKIPFLGAVIRLLRKRLAA